MKKMTPLFVFAVIALSCSNQQPKTADSITINAAMPIYSIDKKEN